MEDIARRAGVAKGTLYICISGIRRGCQRPRGVAFAPMHALAKEILDDKTPTTARKAAPFLRADAG